MKIKRKICIAAGYSEYTTSEKVIYPDRLRKDLTNPGYCLIRARETNFLKFQLGRALRKLQRASLKAPADGPQRRRYYSSYIMVPSNDEVSTPHYFRSHFQQSVDFNPETSAERRFEPIPVEIENNKLFQEFLRSDLEVAKIKDKNGHLMALHVEIHLITMVATEHSDGVATPDKAHKDGDFVFFLHLIDVQDVTGGESVLYRNGNDAAGPKPGAELFRTTLRPGDTLAVSDSLVWHYVSPVKVVPGCKSGHRTVMIVGVTPMLQGHMSVNGRLDIEDIDFPKAA